MLFQSECAEFMIILKPRFKQGETVFGLDDSLVMNIKGEVTVTKHQDSDGLMFTIANKDCGISGYDEKWLMQSL